MENSTTPKPNVSSGSGFEVSLKEMEKIVTQLEKGDTPIEEQLKAFERGVALSRTCMKQLEEVERRVETLLQNSEGKLTTTPFETPN